MLIRLPHRPHARLALIVDLTGKPERLPHPQRHPELDLPVVNLIATTPSAPDKVALALDCALGRVTQVAGAFAP